MVHLKFTIYAAAIALFPGALSARTHGQAVAGFPLVSGLAKSAAGSANSAGSFTRQDLVGLWESPRGDSSGVPFAYSDTLEMFFGSDGRFESRIKVWESPLSNGEVLNASSHTTGTWTLTDTSLNLEGQNCRMAGTDTGALQVSCIGSEVIPTAGWVIQTSGGRKVWSMPKEDTHTIPDDSTYLYYASAEPRFTLPALIPNALVGRNPYGGSRPRRTFSFYPGNPSFSSLPLLDLRGKAVAPGHRGSGFYFPGGSRE